MGASRASEIHTKHISTQREILDRRQPGLPNTHTRARQSTQTSSLISASARHPLSNLQFASRCADMLMLVLMMHDADCRCRCRQTFDILLTLTFYCVWGP